MRETSLDDFLDGSDDEQSEGTPSGDDRPEATEDDEPEASAPTAVEPVDPATAIYSWTPRGEDCADCGATVKSRWRDGGRSVCGDCKNW